MIKIIMTTEDGWDCAPAIMEVSELLPQAREMYHEIQCCKRSMSAKEMLSDLNDFVTDLKQRIDDAAEELGEVEFQTVEDAE
jgi:flagellar biosynthesis chaperone FliJ